MIKPLPTAQSQGGRGEDLWPLMSQGWHMELSAYRRGISVPAETLGLSSDTSGYAAKSEEESPAPHSYARKQLSPEP